MIDSPGVLWHGRSGYGRLLLDLVLVKMGLLLGNDSFGGHEGVRKFAVVVQAVVIERLFSEESAKCKGRRVRVTPPHSKLFSEAIDDCEASPLPLF